MKKKTFFLDAPSIRKEDLNYFLYTAIWPVPENLFKKLTNFLYNEYIKELKKLDEESYKIASIEIRFIELLINIFHYNYVKNFASENNYTFHFSNSSAFFFILIGINYQ